MNQINAPPPPWRLKSSTGIDSVFVQYKGINKSDVDRFCRDYGWSHKSEERGKYTRKWKIFLARGHPITVVYHFASKTTTFQIGKLMNYSRNLNDQHDFVQKVVHHFSGQRMRISELHFAIDLKIPIDSVLLSSPLKLKSNKQVGSTRYLNMSDRNVIAMYDKAVQMQIYSTDLTRLELRLGRDQLSRWNVQDFINDRTSLEKFASHIMRYLDEGICISTVDKRVRLKPDMGDPVKVFEDFVAFLQGGNKPVPKDHFKVRSALQARDVLFTWFRNKGIRDIGNVNAFVKGKKAHYLKEIGIDHKTFYRRSISIRVFPILRCLNNAEMPC